MILYINNKNIDILTRIINIHRIIDGLAPLSKIPLNKYDAVESNLTSDLIDEILSYTLNTEPDKQVKEILTSIKTVMNHTNEKNITIIIRM